jgi:hypothetical protein
LGGELLGTRLPVARVTHILEGGGQIVTRTKFGAWVASLAFAALVLAAGVAAADVQSGTWKMNAAKSKFAGPTPKSATLKIECDGNHIKVDAQGVGANDQATRTQFEANFDGKDYPANGLPVGDRVSVKRVDANTIEVIMKKDGQALMRVTSAVSKDGKTRTSTYQGKNAQGEEIHTVVVYDRE